MSPIDRKAAIRDYKERQPERGVFRLSCQVSESCWVGAAMDLNAARNSTLFQLRNNSHRDPRLQSEWNAHGEEMFRFEVLETLDADLECVLVPDTLKEKKKAWAARLSASMLLP
jgi:hypothetical protein